MVYIQNIGVVCESRLLILTYLHDCIFLILKSRIGYNNLSRKPMMIFDPIVKITTSSSGSKPSSYLVVSLIHVGSSSREKVNKKIYDTRLFKIVGGEEEALRKIYSRVLRQQKGGCDSQCDASIGRNWHNTYHIVTWILIDDKSSCDVMYTGISMRLGIRDRDLTSYEGRSSTILPLAHAES